MEKYVVLEKEVGETPLSCAERWRATRPDLANTPLSYAGRLDPMASGKLLVLIGDECKHQTDYHGLDKEYEFSVLFGIASDTHDVLGRLTTEQNTPINRCISSELLGRIVAELVGEITFPYPLFSAKTVQGKPLHMWTLEGRLDEIEIPSRTSTIYELELTEIETKPRQEVAATALQKINTIPEVTDPRKALGADFRRKDVRADWKDIATNFALPSEYTIAHFRCVASSGAYMRTLATIIAEKCNTTGLAYHIHRSKIGNFDKQNQTWTKEL
ncbi:MAG: tRNA pseudouridine synthase tRNA pseudouridine55 synthase [Candidatus Parcubacteria bacterium]|jgi:tRNA pseudouridine(55) synthase